MMLHFDNCFIGKEVNIRVYRGEPQKEYIGVITEILTDALGVRVEYENNTSADCAVYEWADKKGYFADLSEIPQEPNFLMLALIKLQEIYNRKLREGDIETVNECHGAIVALLRDAKKDGDVPRMYDREKEHSNLT